VLLTSIDLLGLYHDQISPLLGLNVLSAASPPEAGHQHLMAILATETHLATERLIVERFLKKNYLSSSVVLDRQLPGSIQPKGVW
jgi:hypothetical protein